MRTQELFHAHGGFPDPVVLKLTVVVFRIGREYQCLATW
jgi:hypothetical protein